MRVPTLIVAFCFLSTTALAQSLTPRPRESNVSEDQFAAFHYLDKYDKCMYDAFRERRGELMESRKWKYVPTEEYNSIKFMRCSKEYGEYLDVLKQLNDKWGNTELRSVVDGITELESMTRDTIIEALADVRAIIESQERLSVGRTPT